MFESETIQDVIERISQARDRYQNAGDAGGARTADWAIAQLQSLDPSQLEEAHQIEEAFNRTSAIHVGPHTKRSWWQRTFSPSEPETPSFESDAFSDNS